MFLAINLSAGSSLPTKKITSDGKYKTPQFSALTLKYGVKARGDSWQDHFYGMPHKGIGVYLPRFSMRKELGDPFSVFLFQGAQIKRINKNVSFDYEINLGASFNWNRFNAYTDPMFIVFGSSTNVHLAGNWYFNWRLSKRFDLHAGANITHFSNGALRTPNNGLNNVSPFVEIVYNLQKEKTSPNSNGMAYPPPAFKKGTAHDFNLLFTTHTVKLDSAENGLISKYPRQRFKVAGISYSYMFHNTRRFKWGPSMELLYDESVNTTFKGETNPLTGEYREYYQLGKMADRFSAGLSLKGEFCMPGYSIFTNLGYDVYHKDRRKEHFYQIYGVKVFLLDSLFATFSVRSTKLAHSQYLYLSVGYSIFDR